MKTSLEDNIGCGLLVLHIIGYIIFVIYKFTYAKYYDLSSYSTTNFVMWVIFAQSLCLELIAIPVIKSEITIKSFWKRLLLYGLAFIAIMTTTYALMSLVDFITGRPWSICF